MKEKNMAIPGKVVTRIFRFGIRLSLLNKTPRSCSFQSERFRHNYRVSTKYSCKIHQSSRNISTKKSKVEAMTALSANDPSSFSKPESAITKHISLSLFVDFDQKVLDATATLKLEVLQNEQSLILDVSNLTIEHIELENGQKLDFTVDSHVPNFGSKLTIRLPTPPPSAGDELTIKIKYKTCPDATALQWLQPSQTSGKQYPYLFSQCQPIHARSILPCQDTPTVKFTYDAEVIVPAPFVALMSAIRGEVKGNTTSFQQPVPLPSYLFAIAVGVLENRRLGPRSHVWSEKQEIESSAFEFAETESYLRAAEKLVGPYVWTQYDLLVLPPSFPYGGMENPCLTFVTPTLLAGDRSLANVIIHEIMHSWTGNLVTNKNSEHFWLNEGFTVFLERKVMASLADPAESKRVRDFESIMGLQELKETINQLGPGNPLTALVPNLSGVHPDDAFSRVPYEKGSLFLRYLENLVGGPEQFDEFIRSYLNHYMMKSIDTMQFKNYFLNYFKDNKGLTQVDWDAWLYRPGMPPVIPVYDQSLTTAINELIVKLELPDYEPNATDVKDFTPAQKIHFLQELIDRPPLPLEMLQKIGDTYSLSKSKNSELQYRWLRLNILCRDINILPNVFTFVNHIGRMKFVRPLYRDLYDWEEVRERAQKNFLENEDYMMHVSAYTLRKDLHLN